MSQFSRWTSVAALSGLVGGVVAGLLEVVVNGAPPSQIAVDGFLGAASVSVGAGVATVPLHWSLRGLVGGMAFGLAHVGLEVGLALTTAGWDVFFAGVLSGAFGGLLLSYLWRPEAAIEGESAT